MSQYEYLVRPLIEEINLKGELLSWSNLRKVQRKNIERAEPLMHQLRHTGFDDLCNAKQQLQEAAVLHWSTKATCDSSGGDIKPSRANRANLVQARKFKRTSEQRLVEGVKASSSAMQQLKAIQSSRSGLSVSALQLAKTLLTEVGEPETCYVIAARSRGGGRLDLYFNYTSSRQDTKGHVTFNSTGDVLYRRQPGLRYRRTSTS